MAFLLLACVALTTGCGVEYSNVKRHMKLGDYSAARETLTSSGPNDAEGWTLLTECDYWLEDYPALADASRASLRFSSEYQPRIAYFLQRAYIELLNNAIVAFEDDRESDGKRLFSDAVTVGEAIDASISPSLSAIKDEVLVLAGSNYLRMRYYADARRCFEQVRATRGEDPEALERLAFCDFQLQNYDSCLADCEALLDLQPENASALVWQAQATDILHNPELAATAYRDALEVDTNDVTLHRNMGIILFQLEKWDPARQHLEIAYHANPDQSDDLLVLIGECCFNAGEYMDALDYFKTANSVKPDDPDILRYLGTCYWNLGHRQEAEASWMQANQLGK